MLAALSLLLSLSPGVGYAEGSGESAAPVWDEETLPAEAEAPQDDVPVFGSCGDDLTWILDENGTLTISGSGAMWDYATAPTPWSESLEQVTAIVVEPGVTGIGFAAFYNCSAVKTVTLPESLTGIGSHAFGFCVSLESLTLPDSVTTIQNAAFSNCRSLKEIVIPDGVTQIGGDFFYQCYSLRRVTLPETVTDIEFDAFYACTSLTEIRIPSGVQRLADFAFCGCSALREIRFAGGAPSFGSTAFDGVAATAYYPAKDPSWTEEIRQSYGGEITWVGEQPEGLPGDIDADGKRDNEDVTALIRGLKYGDLGAAPERLDLNGDGELDNRDVTRLIRALRYKDAELP